MKNFNTPTLLLAITLLPTLTGCKGGFLSDAKIKGYVENNATYVDASVMMQTGSVILPALEIPVLDPKNPGTTLGVFSLRPTLGNAQTEMAIKVNLTAAAKVQAFDGHYLPNGTKVPIGGIDSMQVIAIPIDSKGTLLYVAVDTTSKQALLGAAIPVREFANLSPYVGGMNVFPAFRFKDILAVAGIYTSAPGVGKNGLGIFVDASSLFKDRALANSLVSTSDGSSELRIAGAAPAVQKLDFSGSKGAANSQVRMYKALDHLGAEQRGVPVTIGE